jgi:anti-sigma-K factor RskA
MSEMERERFDELKEAFVLGALPYEERREFEEYLEAHPEQQAEIDELGAVAGLLALSPQEQEPPQELRRSIMAVVETEAVRPRAASGLARMREFLGIRSLALGAAALLVIGLSIWNVILQEHIHDLQGQAPRDGRLVALEGSGAARQARVQVMILDNGQDVLMAEDMPPVPEEKTFQIWVVQNDVRKAGGLFEPRERWVVTRVEIPLDEADAIAITVEPDGGSRQPTTDPMLTAKL